MGGIRICISTDSGFQESRIGEVIAVGNQKRNESEEGGDDSVGGVG